MSRITAINKIIEFRRDLYYRAYYPDSNLSIDATNLQKQIADPENLKLLKSIMSKLD